MAFITGPDLKQAVADTLGQDVTALDARWAGICNAAASRAYEEILARLAARGYTRAQADSWRAGEEYQRRQGLYWALVEGAGLHSFADAWVDKLRVTDEEWAALAILDGAGNLLLPAGLVNHGDCLADSEIFRDARLPRGLYPPYPGGAKRGAFRRW